MNTLDVKVGDIVVVHPWMGNKFLAKVEKVTQTMVIVQKSRYRKKDGSAVSGSYTSSSISMATPEDMKEIKENFFIYNIVRKLRKIETENITYEQAMKIKQILKL